MSVPNDYRKCHVLSGFQGSFNTFYRYFSWVQNDATRILFITEGTVQITDDWKQFGSLPMESGRFITSPIDYHTLPLSDPIPHPMASHYVMITSLTLVRIIKILELDIQSVCFSI